MFRSILALLVGLCFGLSAFAAEEKFQGRCTVLQQDPFKLLVTVDVALKPGETKTIYTQGRVRYEVSLVTIPGNHVQEIYILQTVITYGAPNYLAKGTASYSDAALQEGAVIGAGVSLPGFPSFGCGNSR